ncbi:MAG: hypothetical protein HZA06_02315 [Nitrospirae bacterium]|nr:hypothetical protein [Nitrospirota bacterium]
MMRIIFLLIFALNAIITPSVFAEEIVHAKSSEANILKAEYHELFEAMPINSNMAVQDFLDGLAAYEETKKRLEVIRVTILYRSCKFKDNE